MRAALGPHCIRIETRSSTSVSRPRPARRSGYAATARRLGALLAGADLHLLRIPEHRPLLEVADVRQHRGAGRAQAEDGVLDTGFRDRTALKKVTK